MTHVPASESPIAVYAAIAVNLAMIAEGIHSVIGTGNEGLLLGIWRSHKAPDELHPFG